MHHRLIAMSCACLLALCVPLYTAHSQDIDALVTLEQVTDYRSQPLALLARFPQAGTAMARYVANLVSKQPSIVQSIMTIIADATPEQAAAIGAGVARSMRLFSHTKPEVSAAISDSSLRAQNPWYKTTFHAIDTGYVHDAPVVIPDPIPPVPLSSEYVGLELPNSAGRVGPARIAQPVPIRFEAFGNRGDSGFLVRRGTIVAIIASGREENGAVSTSPTQ